ncbi:MAG: HD domain-containing protein [Candidatus Omnitrophica bacterium]|nr:HD domain-containing protein [Candidatus Omnitrophota bacterium]
MKEKIESCIRDLLAVLQISRLYTFGHPQVKRSIEKAYASITEIFKERKEFIIGIVSEEIVFEKEIFFSLSKMARPVVIFLKAKGIEKIHFLSGLQQDELEKFISFLLDPEDGARDETIEDYLSRMGVKNILVGKIKMIQGEDKVWDAVTRLSLYEDSLRKVDASVNAVINEDDLDHLTLRYTLKEVMEKLIGQYQEFLDFATVKKYDTRTFSHILNVCILAMYFSSKLGLDKEGVLEIGKAAIFHDIGKIYISRKLIRKESVLSDEEFAKIKNHAVLGAEILLNYSDKLGILPAVVSFEHHMKYNLSGYPKLSFPYKPHLASLIVAICDVYDALSQRRGYKRSYPPELVYEIMMKEKGVAFEPNLLDRFFELIGVWPVGARVKLNDGRIAVVKEINSDEIFYPKVEIQLNTEGAKQLVDLKAEKDRLKIESSLF